MFSIIIPFYNTDLPLLLRAIDSVIYSSKLCQFSDFEIILVDDGSEFDYESVIKVNFPNNRISFEKLFHNCGRSFARNYGIKKSKFKYILFLDSDDVVLPNYFEVIEEYIYLLNEDFKYLTFSYKLNNFNVFRIFNPFQFKNISPQNYKFYCTDSILIEKSVFKEFLFDESLVYGEDLKLWNLISSKFNGMHINIPIVRYYFDYKSYGNHNELKRYFKLFKAVKYLIKFEFFGLVLKSKLITKI